MSGDKDEKRGGGKGGRGETGEEKGKMGKRKEEGGEGIGGIDAQYVCSYAREMIRGGWVVSFPVCMFSGSLMCLEGRKGCR